MTAIPTGNLDQGSDSPKQARADLLAAITTLNALTQSINTAVSTLLEIDNNMLVSGNTSLLGNLNIQGLLSFSQNAGTLGQILASQGPGQPVGWTNATKYVGASITSLTIDTLSPKTIVVDKGLSYSAGQAIVVSNDATHLMVGLVQSYDASSGNLTFINTSQIGSGTFTSWTVNLTGATGAAGAAGTGGAGGAGMLYDNTSRYQGSTTTGLGSTIVSSSSVKTGVAWSRTTTNLVITDPNHGRSIGERAIVRNTNVSYFDSLITAADTNTYTVTTTDTGAASGAAGAYSMGFTFAYIGAPSSITGCQVFAPANWDCVLLGLRLHIAGNTRGATTHNVTVPKGNVNGVGPQTSMDALSIPNQTVRQDGNTLASVGATIAVNLSGDFGVFQFAALPAATTGIHIVMNF